MIENERFFDIFEVPSLELVGINDSIFADVLQQRVSKTTKGIDGDVAFAIKLLLQRKLREGFGALGHTYIRDLKGGLPRRTGAEGEEIGQPPAHSFRFGVFEAGIFMNERAGV